MKYIWIVIFVLVVSCNSEQQTEKALYNEYIAAFYNAYVQTKNEISDIVEPMWENEDTILIDQDCYLNISDGDNYSTKQIIAPANLIIKKVSSEIIELQLVTDSSIRGYINKEFLRNSIAYCRYQNKNKSDFYDSFLTNKELIIDSIISKNGMTEKEFYLLLAKENFRRTGNETFLIE